MHHSVPVPRDEFDHDEGLPTDAELQWAVDQLPDSIDTARVRAALAGVPWGARGTTAAQRLRSSREHAHFQGPPVGGWKASRV